MNCLFCGKGPREGVTVFRINPKGQEGVWACEKHINNTDAPPIDPVVKQIADAFNSPGARHD